MKTVKAILANFDLSELPNIINKTNYRVAQNERKSYLRTVENWSEKPDFYIKINNVYSGGMEDYKVYTDSLIYLWVDEGTDWHTITPNGDYPLKVKGARGYGEPPYNKQAYEPKTSRDGNRLSPSGAGQYLDDDGYFSFVRQKIEPRNFTIMIKEKARDRWVRALQTEIDKYAKGNIR